MKRPFIMPKLGLTMTEGVVAEWLVPPGGRFERDQAVFVVETDKAANEIAAEQGGLLLEIVQSQGATVPVGALLAYWDDGVMATDGPVSTAASPSAAAPVAAMPTSAPRSRTAPAELVVAPSRIVATPLARIAARRAGIDLSCVAGSGPRGRIKAADVAVAARQPVARPDVAWAPRWRRGWRVEPGRVASAMARRLARVQLEIPCFYLAQEADVGQLLTLRLRLLAAELPKLSLTHFIIAAVGRALDEVPGANRVWAEGAWFDLVASDVGLAVNSDHGLLVPVIRAAGRCPLAELARQVQHLIHGARAGTLRLDQMLGGAVTVSNAGRRGVSNLTPMINPGQSMVLGVGAVRPVFRPDAQGQPTLRQELGLVLACDHRVFDGMAGMRFLQRVVHHLEAPQGLMAPARPVPRV